MTATVYISSWRVLLPQYTSVFLDPIGGAGTIPHRLLQSQQIFADSTCCNYPIEKCRLRSRPDTPILSAVASNTGTEKRWPLLVLNQRHKTRSQALYSWAITCLCEYDELHNVMLCLSATWYCAGSAPNQALLTTLPVALTRCC